jgi:23S rRNA (pseudouridine1915-N3)-methyltransferase
MDMIIKIITIGNKPSPELQTLIAEYIKRFPRTISITWQYLKHANGDVLTSKQQESENILRAIDTTDFVVLLDETGKQLSSPELSELIFHQNNTIVFIIGGSYGVNETVHKRAQVVWSLSKLVFPHQLVRLLLSEQLYRAYSIHINHPYHHS